MKLTPEQRRAVKYDGNALIVACPGSGKTRTLVAKLLHCLDEVRGTARRLACITYTNAAVYEIESRLRKEGSTGDEIYCDISTIHSFCLNNILQNFYWKLDKYENGFMVLPSDSDHFREIARAVCAEYDLPSSWWEKFELFNREPDGIPITTDNIDAEVALDFWDRLSKEGLIDFPNIIYYSYRILEEYPGIVHAIACRFAWFLVDEFQDTSALQVEILRLVAARNKTKFFLVGDPHQSIYGFAGARPDLLNTFANEINAKRDFKLLINFRSSNPVIEHAEKLCPRVPPMSAGGPSTVFTDQPQYIHCSTAFNGITEHFFPLLDDLGIEYGQCAILAPWWVKLLLLGRQLRDYGIPIVGPGARPYKRVHLFALLAEQICAYIENPEPKAFYRIEKELYKLIINVTASANFRVYTYYGKMVIYRLIKCARTLKDKCENGIVWLEEAAKNFSDILIDAEFLPEKAGKLLIESVEGMKMDMLNQRVDLESLTTSDLGMFANVDGNLKLLTMHNAKGREFDAVAVIDLHDGKIPHASARTQEDIDQYRRLFYVSITRARRIVMYMTDNEDWRPPSRFLLDEGLGFSIENF